MLAPAATDLDQEDDSFHTDGSTDVHLGFARDELQQQAETAGFEDLRFSTTYGIKKMIGDEERAFPDFLMTARKR